MINVDLVVLTPRIKIFKYRNMESHRGGWTDISEHVGEGWTQVLVNSDLVTGGRSEE